MFDSIVHFESLEILNVEDLKSLEKDISIYILGAGEFGISILEVLEKNTIMVSGIFDNNKNKCSTQVKNYTITSIDKLSQIDKNSLFILGTQGMGLIEMYHQLMEYGINNSYWVDCNKNYNNKYDKKLINLIADLDKLTFKKSDKGEVGIIIHPWEIILVPWYSILLGYLINISKKVNIKFIWNDMFFGVDVNKYYNQNKRIKEVLEYIEGSFEYVSLSSFLINDNMQYNEEEIEIACNLNTIHFNKGETYHEKAYKYKEIIRPQLIQAYYAINNFMENQKFEYLILPGGIYGCSGILYKEAEKRGIRVSTYDSGEQLCLVSTSGIAAKLGDIPTALEMLNSSISEDIMSTIKGRVDIELKNRKSGTDLSGYLKHSQQYKYEHSNYATMFLNVSWDSAVLGAHKIFNGNLEWIEETVSFILDNTSLDVIIRQHPAEKNEISRTVDNYVQFIQEKFNKNKRIRIISAEENINSYSLIENSKFVLVGTSTIGVEAVINSKVVITECDCYYSKSGIVFKAHSLEEYYNLIKAASEGKLIVSEEQKNKAAQIYYLAQCCNWIRTYFNPINFLDNDINIVELMDNQTIKMIIDSIHENIPISYLKHLANIEGNMI